MDGLVANTGEVVRLSIRDPEAAAELEPGDAVILVIRPNGSTARYDDDDRAGVRHIERVALSFDVAYYDAHD